MSRDDSGVDQVRDNTPSKVKTGFGKFVYINLGKDSYYQNITKYETRIRKEVVKLKGEKKISSSEDQKVIEKRIAKLKSDLMSTTDNAVLNYLMAYIRSGNEIDLNKVRKTQSGIAEELCLERTAVSRSFAKLKRLNVISYKTEGNAFSWIRVSPYICWQGEAGTHARLIARMRENFSRKPFELSLEDIMEISKNKQSGI